MTSDEKNSALFASLVMMFQSAAMQNLGKIKSPLSDNVERNVEQAQLTIRRGRPLRNRTPHAASDQGAGTR